MSTRKAMSSKTVFSSSQKQYRREKKTNIEERNVKWKCHQGSDVVEEDHFVDERNVSIVGKNKIIAGHKLIVKNTMSTRKQHHRERKKTSSRTESS